MDQVVNISALTGQTPRRIRTSPPSTHWEQVYPAKRFPDDSRKTWYPQAQLEGVGRVEWSKTTTLALTGLRSNRPAITPAHGVVLETDQRSGVNLIVKVLDLSGLVDPLGPRFPVTSLPGK